MNNLEDDKIGWPHFFSLLIIISSVCFYCFVLPKFNMSLENEHIFAMAFINILGGLFCWAVTFTKVYKTLSIRIISWIVFIPFLAGSTDLYIICMRSGFLPFPPTGLVAYDYILMVIFVCIALYASWIVMKLFKKWD
jgi:hypothetical protein